MTENIAIIGGGIGGLTTALCLEKLDIPYKLYEKAVSIKEVGAGIWLSPNALQVFEWINPGLLEAIQHSGNTLTRILLANHKMKPISDADQKFIKDVFGYSTLAIHRGTLQKILFDFSNKKRILLNHTFNDYNFSDKNFVKVNFDNKTTIKTKSVIGADGINSKVRQQLFPRSRTRYSGQTCWRGISKYKIAPELESTGFTLWGQKLEFGVSKVSDDKVYWFAVKLSPPDQKYDQENIKSVLRNMFANFHPVVVDLIVHTPIEKIIQTDLFDLELLSAWNKKNICLLGDAAHSMTPDLGQGGAQAIEDAYYLSNFINNHREFDKAFDKFYRYRKRKVEKLVKQSRFTSKIAIMSKFGEILRNFLIKNIPERYKQKQMIDLCRLDKAISDQVVDHKN